MPPRPVQVDGCRACAVAPVLPTGSAQRAPSLSRSSTSRVPGRGLLCGGQLDGRVPEQLSVAEHKVKSKSTQLVMHVECNEKVADEPGPPRRSERKLQREARRRRRWCSPLQNRTPRRYLARRNHCSAMKFADPATRRQRCAGPVAIAASQNWRARCQCRRSDWRHDRERRQSRLASDRPQRWLDADPDRAPRRSAPDRPGATSHGGEEASTCPRVHFVRWRRRITRCIEGRR